jgi:protein NUD1
VTVKQFLSGFIAGMESTPSKAEGHRRTDSSVLVPLSARSSAFSHTHSESRSETQSVSLVAHSSEEYRQPPRGTQTTTTYTSRARHTVSVQANQTILTECSFAVTQDKLVQLITQVQPYEPHWENLPEIDLSGRAIESVTRMKEFLPSLVRLDLSVFRYCRLLRSSLIIP